MRAGEVGGGRGAWFLFLSRRADLPNQGRLWGGGSLGSPQYKNSGAVRRVQDKLNGGRYVTAARQRPRQTAPAQDAGRLGFPASVCAFLSVCLPVCLRGRGRLARHGQAVSLAGWLTGWQAARWQAHDTWTRQAHACTDAMQRQTAVLPGRQPAILRFHDRGRSEWPTPPPSWPQFGSSRAEETSALQARLARDMGSRLSGRIARRRRGDGTGGWAEERGTEAGVGRSIMPAIGESLFAELRGGWLPLPTEGIGWAK